VPKGYCFQNLQHEDYKHNFVKDSRWKEITGEFRDKIGKFINKINFRLFSVFLLLLLATGLTQYFQNKAGIFYYT